jgi:hypothetical protein
MKQVKGSLKSFYFLNQKGFLIKETDFLYQMEGIQFEETSLGLLKLN